MEIAIAAGRQALALGQSSSAPASGPPQSPLAGAEADRRQQAHWLANLFASPVPVPSPEALPLDRLRPPDAGATTPTGQGRRARRHRPDLDHARRRARL